MAASLPSAPGIRIIGPNEVLREHTKSLPDGRLLFQEANGATVRFVTDVADPEITNQGDGSFHPASETVVLEALAEIRRDFLSPLEVTIYILPYPRSGRLSSSADDQAIYLSPGVREYESWQIAYLVTHEIGHVVHRHFLPDSLASKWDDWAALRGLSGRSIYAAGAEHANRPHEIFAEDFRVLFGGVEAQHGGQIENREILLPKQVPGLIDFYLSLAGVRMLAAAAALQLGPNPMRPGDRLRLELPAAATEKSTALVAGVFDLGGRRVAELRFQLEGDQLYRSAWDGRDADGVAVPSGAYWLRVETARGASVLPIRLLH
jgi:hypothetical protein